tara:strand:- start:237 stop:830 length:594 start_codon:yes stop_codon:yes gene_type:complete
MGADILKTINNHSLKTFILDLKKKDKGRFVSNYGGWQSNDLSVDDNPIKDLIVEIKKNLTPFEEALRLRKDFKLKVANIWANVSGMGASNTPHLHDNSVLSGVYYVTRPEVSGNLRLMNPNLFNYVTISSLGKHSTFLEGLTPFTINHLDVPAVPGSLVIFPSHLCHYVLPNLGKEERISISFNTVLVKKKEIDNLS